MVPRGLEKPRPLGTIFVVLRGWDFLFFAEALKAKFRGEGEYPKIVH